MKVVTQQKREESLRLLKLLVYGLPGSGKTWLCGSAALSPLTAPVLYLDYHAQSASLANLPGLDATNFVHLAIEDYKELSYVYTFLAKGRGYIKELDKLFDATPTGFPKTVCLDSVTELQRRQVLKIAGNDPDSAALPQQFDRPRIQDWGTLLNLFMVLGEKKFALPLNVIFTCLAKYEYEKDSTGEERLSRIAPALQGQATEMLPSTALTVMYLEALPPGPTTTQWGKGESVYNVGHFRVSDRTFARDNTGAFTEDLYNVTIPRMLEVLNARTPTPSADTEDVTGD